MISGIILCTVAFSNKGTNTRLPKLEEEIFLRHIIAVLTSARITDIALVADEVENKLSKRLSDIEEKLYFNPTQKSGYLLSICTGINNISKDDLHGVMVCPIDHPLITQRLLVNLLQGFWHSKKDIVVPLYNGTRGYPVIFGRDFFNVLQTAPQEIGVLEIIRNHNKALHEVNTDEEGVTLTISSLEEYKKYSGVINA